MATKGPRRTGMAMRSPWSVCSNVTLPSSFSYMRAAPCLEIVARSTLGRPAIKLSAPQTDKDRAGSGFLRELSMPRLDRLSAVLPSVLFALCCTLQALLAPNNLLAQSAGKGANRVQFRNTDPSVGYVGSKSCTQAGCHAEIGSEYFST